MSLDAHFETSLSAVGSDFLGAKFARSENQAKNSKMCALCKCLKDVEILSCLLSPASSWHLSDKAHNELLSIFVAGDQSAVWGLNS